MPVPSLGAFVGDLFSESIVSPAVLEFDRERNRLLSVLHEIWHQAQTTDFDGHGNLSRLTWNTAVAFVKRFDLTIPLPKVAPDGDGSILFKWSIGTRDIVGVIDGITVGFIVGAGDPGATYIAPKSLDDAALPQIVWPLLK